MIDYLDQLLPDEPELSMLIVFVFIAGLIIHAWIQVIIYNRRKK